MVEMGLATIKDWEDLMTILGYPDCKFEFNHTTHTMKIISKQPVDDDTKEKVETQKPVGFLLVYVSEINKIPIPKVLQEWYQSSMRYVPYDTKESM